MGTYKEIYGKKRIILFILLMLSIKAAGQIKYIGCSDTITSFKCYVSGNYINLPSINDSLSNFKNNYPFPKIDNLCMLYFKMIKHNGKYYYVLFEEYELTYYVTRDSTRYKHNSYSGSFSGVVNGKSYHISYNMPYVDEYTTKHTEIRTANRKEYTIFSEKDYLKLFSGKNMHIHTYTSNFNSLGDGTDTESFDINERITNRTRKSGSTDCRKYFQIKKENNIVKFQLLDGFYSNRITDLDLEDNGCYVMGLDDLYKLLYINK